MPVVSTKGNNKGGKVEIKVKKEPLPLAETVSALEKTVGVEPPSPSYSPTPMAPSFASAPPAGKYVYPRQLTIPTSNLSPEAEANIGEILKNIAVESTKAGLKAAPRGAIEGGVKGVMAGVPLETAAGGSTGGLASLGAAIGGAIAGAGTKAASAAVKTAAPMVKEAAKGAGGSLKVAAGPPANILPSAPGAPAPPSTAYKAGQVLGSLGRKGAEVARQGLAAGGGGRVGAERREAAPQPYQQPYYPPYYAPYPYSPMGAGPYEQMLIASYIPRYGSIDESLGTYLLSMLGFPATDEALRSVMRFLQSMQREARR
jgi:hypothetical protein